MPEIKISLKEFWSFHFDTDDPEALNTKSRRCSYCGGTSLNSVYCYIIDCLKEGGLLDENYRETCCYCYVMRDYGLLDIQPNLRGFFYYKQSDILAIKFSFRRIVNHTFTIVEFTIRIHDWSKIGLF